MADPTLEEQQFQTEIFLSICQRQADQMWYIDQVRLDIQAQTAIVQAQAADVSALKSKVESFQNAFWITAFSVCLCFGAILFRIFTRSAASKRLLGILLACFISVSAFAQSGNPNPWVSYDAYSEYSTIPASGYLGSIALAGDSNDIGVTGNRFELTFYNCSGYTIRATAEGYDENGDWVIFDTFNPVVVSSSSHSVIFNASTNCALLFTCSDSGEDTSSYTPPSFVCESDSKYDELRNKLESCFPSFSDILSSSVDSTEISYTFYPDLSAFLPGFYGIKGTVKIDQEKVTSGDSNSMEIDHTVFTGPLKLVIKFVFSIFAFAYCFKELRQW